MSDSTSIWQIVAWLATAIGAVTAAVFGAYNIFRSQQQSRRDLRWRCAEMALKLIDELHDDTRSSHALLLADNMSITPDQPAEASSKITPETAFQALAASDSETSAEIDYVRSCFDRLFYYLDRIEHFIRVGLIEFQDVSTPFEYYAEVLAKRKSVVSDYLNRTRYRRVVEFLDRFPAWAKDQN